MKQPSWVSLGVTCAICLAGGFFLGTYYAVQVARQAAQVSIGTQSGPAFQVGGDRELAQLKIDNARLESIAKTLLARAQVCEANFSTYTVLYEPGTAPSLSVMRGLVDVQVPGLAGPAHPAWVIPAKIEPRVIALQPGLVYGYIDRDTKQIDGPYPPIAIANGDKMTVAGWSAR